MIVYAAVAVWKCRNRLLHITIGHARNGREISRHKQCFWVVYLDILMKMTWVFILFCFAF